MVTGVGAWAGAAVLVLRMDSGAARLGMHPETFCKGLKSRQISTHWWQMAVSRQPGGISGSKDTTKDLDLVVAEEVGGKTVISEAAAKLGFAGDGNSGLSELIRIVKLNGRRK